MIKRMDAGGAFARGSLKGKFMQTFAATLRQEKQLLPEPGSSAGFPDDQLRHELETCGGSFAVLNAL